MKEFEKLGVFYLGKLLNKKTAELTQEPLLYDSKNFTTHAVCLGMTGSGKTGLGIDLIEEAGIDSIPSLIIDPKGDLSDLLLTFPDLSPEEFQPWIDTNEAEAHGMSIKDYATSISNKWKKNLAEWGQSADRIRTLRKTVDMVIYTPASDAGIPLSVLASFAAPPKDFPLDQSALREKILTTTSSLLGLIGLEADPVNSREHILISTIISHAWEQGEDVTLPILIQQIQKPPFDKIGVLDLETFYPSKDRMALSISLNNLLASPVFQAWMKGEPLDIQKLLYSPQGKPKLSIISIAHLSDKERMFFVSLFLNELLSWVRRQPGTSSLRALLYMDEIFGYFPPVATPPSKLPLITLLKQARAFGLGIVLATQNPVDLDYKGLSNCGTWFIGKLQTERDKSKVYEGIKSLSQAEINQETFDKMISQTGQQNFILLSLYEKEPLLFKSRWALSYLRGPLTLNQIQLLTPKSSESKPQAASNLSKAVSNLPPEETSSKPIIPLGIEEFFANRAIPREDSVYQPMLAGKAKIHFIESKNQIDTWQTLFMIAPPSEDGSFVKWELGENRPEVNQVLEKTPWPEAIFKKIPSGLLQEKNYGGFEKSLLSYLYEHNTLTIFQAPDLKLNSSVNESEAEFRARVALSLHEKRDEMLSKIREKYRTKIASLTSKMQQAQEKVEKEKQPAGLQRTESFFSMLVAIIGSFFGRGITKGTINQAGTSIQKVGKIQKESQDVVRAQAACNSYQQQIRELESELNLEISQALAGMDPETLKIETLYIRPKKSNINVEKVSLLWWPVSKQLRDPL